MKIKSGRFVTQIEYRNDGRKFILGWIGEFEKGGVVSKRGFRKAHKSTADGKTWTKKWTSHTGAIRQLLKHHGLDTLWGTYHVVPIPQTFHSTWKDIDYNEIYNPGDELVQETDADTGTESD